MLKAFPINEFSSRLKIIIDKHYSLFNPSQHSNHM